MTRPILKQYSFTARQQTTPPSALGVRARYTARFSRSELPSLAVALLFVDGSGVSVREGAEVILGMTASDGGEGVVEGLADDRDLEPFFG